MVYLGTVSDALLAIKASGRKLKRRKAGFSRMAAQGGIQGGNGGAEN
jgi:hypothetical protein